MPTCPITYEPCELKYSLAGLRLLSPKLATLNDIPLTAQEQRSQSALRAAKMSIQGVQPKLSARLSVVKEALEIVDQQGTYIIKPQSDIYEQLPENEDLTMKMASTISIDIPLTGMVYSKDGSLSYFIKRFDRYGQNSKKHVEDFAQLTGNNRETKYNWSTEKLIPVIDQFCTFPVVEKRKLFRRLLFCFLVGNEDMHLKNFSLINDDSLIKLSPAYDLLNTTIANKGAREEFALPLAGKKSKFTREHLVNYLGHQRLGLHSRILDDELEIIHNNLAKMSGLLARSFLSQDLKEKYQAMLEARALRLFK